MNISIFSLLSLVVGVILGLLYFAGLWMTVKNIIKASSPLVLSLVSFTVRTVTIFLALIFVSRQGSFIDIIIFLIGFIIGRFILHKRVLQAQKEQLEKDLKV